VSDNRIDKAKEYIANNSHVFLSCSDIAEYCGISERHLLRLFKRYENMTVLQFVHKTKLHQIEKMLLKTQLSQETISAHLGFSGSTYMGKFFLRHTGMTPGEYRCMMFCGCGF